MIRTVTWALLAASLLAAVGSVAVARNTSNLSRREIRSMPITERPSRPGHFYGNAVRRNYYRNSQGARVNSNVWQGYSQTPRQNTWVNSSETVVNQ